MSIMRYCALAVIALLLAACGGGGGSPPPPPSPSGQWLVLHSSGMPSSFVDRFTFPQQPGSVHYVVKPATITNTAITLQYAVQGSGALYPTEGASPAAVRLFIQRRGDNLSGAGPYEHYRWWSQPMLLGPGEFTLSAPLDPVYWTSVYGQHNAEGFAAALADLESVGFTFGGDFAGHGVYAVGQVDFIVRNYRTN